MKKKRINKKNEFKSETEFIEKWIIERRNFLIKLSWVISIIVALLIISHIYLRVKGVSP